MIIIYFTCFCYLSLNSLLIVKLYIWRLVASKLFFCVSFYVFGVMLKLNGGVQFRLVEVIIFKISNLHMIRTYLLDFILFLSWNNFSILKLYIWRLYASRISFHMSFYVCGMMLKLNIWYHFHIFIDLSYSVVL